MMRARKPAQRSAMKLRKMRRNHDMDMNSDSGPSPSGQSCGDNSMNANPRRRRKYKRNEGDDSNTRTATEVRSPTRTATEVRSPTKTRTSTEAYTAGNVTVTGGAGEGATTKVTLIQPKKNRGRRNPVPAAQERYERFHGHPSKDLVEVKTTIYSHGVLSAIGDLKKLVIVTPTGQRVIIKGFKGAFLAQNEAATQLYIEGGDQSVNLADFGIRQPVHEKEVLGVCQNVYYFTTKDHLRPEDGGTATYNHRFGRKKPTIVYDVRNQLLEFAGGGYTIPDEGIDG